MHVVYLSQQSRLTLFNMLTQFIRKFYTGFHLLLLPKNIPYTSLLLLLPFLDLDQRRVFWFRIYAAHLGREFPL